MQVMKVRIVPVLLAALAIYAVGFVICGMIVPAETWMAWAGISAEEMNIVGMSRMPLSPVMPLMIAFGTGLAIRWRNAAGRRGSPRRQPDGPRHEKRTARQRPNPGESARQACAVGLGALVWQNIWPAVSTGSRLIR